MRNYRLRVRVSMDCDISVRADRRQDAEVIVRGMELRELLTGICDWRVDAVAVDSEEVVRRRLKKGEELYEYRVVRGDYRSKPTVNADQARAWYGRLNAQHPGQVRMERRRYLGEWEEYQA
jgi:hypothetical protein